MLNQINNIAPKLPLLHGIGTQHTFGRGRGDLFLNTMQLDLEFGGISSKRCSTCKEEKNKSDFYKDKRNKDGLDTRCKECNKKRAKKFREENPEKVKEANRKQHAKNKDKVNKRHRDDYWTNRDEHLAWKAEYDRNNKHKIKKYNASKKEARNEWRKERARIDSLFRLSLNIRCLIYGALTKNGFNKKSKTSLILGCTYEEFKSHIEKQFKDWMTWDNHGVYNGKRNFTWQLDHIIPVSSAKTEEELIKLNHYTNFQPLCSYENRQKWDKLNYIPEA